MKTYIALCLASTLILLGCSNEPIQNTGQTDDLIEPIEIEIPPKADEAAEEDTSKEEDIFADIVFENEEEPPAPQEQTIATEKKTIPAYIFVPDVSTLTRADNNSYYVYGDTSSNCSRVVAEARNITANEYDNYELTGYEYGNTAFKYGIREDWSNLFTGDNTYTFTAYCDDNQVVSTSITLSYSTYIPPVYQDTYQPATPVSIPTPSAYIDSSDDTMSTIKRLYNNEADLFAECNDEYVYLGQIGGKYDSDSIFSKYGDYGSKYSDTSMWYKYGDYGSKYSDCSAFYKYASNPPMIYIGDSLVGHVSMYKYAGGTVVSPNDLLLFAYQKWDDDHWLDLVRD